MTREPIIPMIPYTKKFDIAPYTPFTDYKTGKYYKDNTKFYWKRLSEFLFVYINHNDNKYDGDIGELKRKQIDIGNIEHIGKESNNLEESDILGVSDDDYVTYDNKIKQKISDVIKNLTPKQAKQIGISKRNMRYLKAKIKTKKQIILKKKTLNRLLRIRRSDEPR